MKNLEVWLTAAGFLLTLLIIVGTVTRKLSIVELSISEKISNSLVSIRIEFDEKNQRLRDELDETFKAIRTHIGEYEKKHYELELYIRDNYIEVPTFQNALTEIKDLVKDLVRKVDKISDDSFIWRKEQRNKT